MTRAQHLELLKQIEKDIYVPSIESTFLDDAKSCAIHLAIEELEQETVSKESYDHEYFLRKEFEIKIDELQRQLEEQEQSRDMKEIEEIINCDADAETKCKMISNILTAKPHYFEEPFINKPCVSSEVCEHDKQKMLDKIRAEVENINVWGMRYNPDTDKDRKPQIVQKVKEHVIEIIDKYKAESEDR